MGQGLSGFSILRGAAFNHRYRRHHRDRLQFSVTVKAVQPGEDTLHDKLKLAELLVAAVLLHDQLEQPAELKAAVTWEHTFEVNCESEVPDATV